jgi:predicted nucleotidyltransferase
MRDHQRRTEIRLIVLGEDARQIQLYVEQERTLPAGEARDAARFGIARHVQRFLYFSNLPLEFRECNAAIPWSRLTALRYRYGSLTLSMMHPRSFPTVLRFAKVEVPRTHRLLSSPNFPTRWRNESNGNQGIGQILTPHRARIAKLVRRYGVRRLRVYGSVARGEADTRSDVGLLVEWRSKAFARESLSLREGLEQTIGRKVDLFEPATTYWATRDRVLSEATDFL